MNNFSLPKVFTLIESGPVVLITTKDSKTGKENIMTLSWSMVLEFEPSCFAIMTGGWNYSFKALMENRECVVALPTVEIIEKTIRIGSCSGSEHDKFKEFELTPLRAQKVKAPLIKECHANIECQITDYLENYSILVLTPVKAWINNALKDKRKIHAIGDGTFVADGEKFDYKEITWDKLSDAVK